MSARSTSPRSSGPFAFHAVFAFEPYAIASKVRMSPFGPTCHAWNSLRHPRWHERPHMSKRRYFAHAALAMTILLVITACSSETPTSPPAASLSLTAAPTISIGYGRVSTFAWTGKLCVPYSSVLTRGGCPPSAYLYISNTGGGTLNWTSTKSAAWIKRSPRYGTAPDTMKVWVDGTGLPTGTYYGRIKVWA